LSFRAPDCVKTLNGGFSTAGARIWFSIDQEWSRLA
jgi:hypothetical protein